MTAGQLSRESWWPSPSLDEREPQWRLVRGLVHTAEVLRHVPVLVGVAGVSDQIVVSVHLKREDIVAAVLTLRRGYPPFDQRDGNSWSPDQGLERRDSCRMHLPLCLRPGPSGPHWGRACSCPGD